MNNHKHGSRTVVVRPFRTYWFFIACNGYARKT